MSSFIFKIYFIVKLISNLFIKTFENDPLKYPLNGSATKQSVICSKFKRQSSYFGRQQNLENAYTYQFLV